MGVESFWQPFQCAVPHFAVEPTASSLYSSLAHCRLSLWFVPGACLGGPQAQKAIAFTLWTIPRQHIPSSLGFRCSRKAYSALQ